METLYDASIVVLVFAAVLALTGSLTWRPGITLAAGLLSACGAAVMLVHDLNEGVYKAVAVEAALIVFNVGCFFWYRHDLRKRAAA